MFAARDPAVSVRVRRLAAFVTLLVAMALLPTAPAREPAAVWHNRHVGDGTPVVADGSRSGSSELAPVSEGASPREPGADPAVNHPYRDPDYEYWVSVFEREGREVYDKRQAIVDAAGVRPGMVVADVGAGTGLFTRLFAAKTGPAGRVIAVDISRVFVENILRMAREQRLANVSGIVSTQSDTRLPPASVDLVFICDTYHHFERPREIMRSVHRALRPGGTVVIIDFRKIPGESSGWVMGHVRAAEDEVIREVEASGFAFLGAEKLLRENYFLRFARSG